MNQAAFLRDMNGVKRDIIVVGASAGGVAALQALVGGFTRELAAAVFIVLHQPPWHKSQLADVLSRHSRIPVLPAEAGHAIEHGSIYVAQPDLHLILDGRMDLWRGPKENRYRPAINVLFRSAAVAYQERVCGVVLSGTLDDGSAGLWWIKRYGGVAMVQDPGEADFPDMPANAIEHVSVDYVLPVREMGRVLTDLATAEKVEEGNPRLQR